MLEIQKGHPPASWDDHILALDGSIFHTSHWAAYLARPGVEPWFVLERDGDAVAGAALALRSQSTRPLIGRFFRSMSVTAHPATRGGDAGRSARFLQAVEEEARRHGCADIALESWMSAASPIRPSEFGYREHERVEFQADLRLGPEKLWSALKKDQRERIRHLERDGMTVALGSERSDLSLLRAMQESTQERRQQKGQGYELEGGEAFFDRVHERLVRPGLGRLFLAKRDGEAVGGIFFHVWGGKAYSMFSGSTPEGYRAGAQTYLYWRAVERFLEEGLVLLNRGGVPASAAVEGDPLHGLYRFKTRLGTTPVACYSGTKTLLPALAALRQWKGRRGAADGEERA
jgi:GNAT superfamily N-acetyltransferase